MMHINYGHPNFAQLTLYILLSTFTLRKILLLEHQVRSHLRIPRESHIYRKRIFHKKDVTFVTSS